MHVLVTGGAGYLGSVLTQHLLSAGHGVRVLDCLLHPTGSLLGCYPYDRFQFVHGDVRSPEMATRALEGVDAVVHLAAIVGEPACVRQPEIARQVNLDASLQLFDLARSREISRFIFASTCSNYGRMREAQEYLTEESELRPVSVYAETKVAVERTLLSVPRGRTPCATVLRLATIFGVSPRMRFDLTINEFTLELLRSRRLVVYGEQSWRPYVHVRDAARAITAVLEGIPEQVGGEVFNVGATRENYQKGTVVRMVCEQVGGPVEIERVAQADDPRDYRVSFEKIRRVLGFEVTRTVPDGICEVVTMITQRVITDLDNPAYRN